MKLKQNNGMSSISKNKNQLNKGINYFELFCDNNHICPGNKY
jgi:hypothetical protein